MNKNSNEITKIITDVLTECDTAAVGIGETGDTVDSGDIFAPGDSRKPALIGAGVVPGKKKKKNKNNTFPPIIKRNS